MESSLTDASSTVNESAQRAAEVVDEGQVASLTRAHPTPHLFGSLYAVGNSASVPALARVGALLNTIQTWRRNGVNAC